MPVILAGGRAFGAIQPDHERVLAFQNLHTGEALETVYWVDGTYRPQALGEINHLLRDFRTGDVTDINPKLLDLLHTLHRKIRVDQPFHVISGYRSPKTNDMLADQSSGVARKSYHTRGMAIDVRVPRCKLRTLHTAALELKAGGVGYYGKSNFIHVDVGPVRRW